MALSHGNAIPDAMIAAFLAQESQRPGAILTVEAPPGVEQTVRDRWVATAEDLAACTITLHVIGNFPRSVVWQPGLGLLVRDHELLPWAEVPDAILAQHAPLLGEIKKQRIRLQPLAASALLQAVSTATIEEAVLAEPEVEDEAQEDAPEESPSEPEEAESDVDLDGVGEEAEDPIPAWMLKHVTPTGGDVPAQGEA